MLARIARAAVVVLVLAAAVASPSIAEEGRDLRVTRAVTGSGVEDRVVVGESDTFPEGTEVVFWTMVEGGASGDSIDHVWIREGEEVVTVGLAVGSARWRTWSRKTLYPGAAGAWSVEARDREGNVLATVSFTCTAGSEASAE
jgi:hypothetical protein